MNSNCSLSITAPTTDGANVYVTSTVTCGTYMGHTAVQVGTRIQEQVGPAWTSRTAWSYAYSSGSTSLSKSSSYNCNGHGTDNWRGQGYGQTTDNGESTATGSTRSLTC